ncbi:hypothetical protein ACPV5U_25620 [Vibrio mediterranei]
MGQQHVSYSLSKQRSGIEVNMTVLNVGRDLMVAIYGGDQAHIGATALAQPRASLEDPERVSASTSVMCILGHKEELLAHHAAQSLASSLNRVVCVSCGIHIDNAGKEHIRVIQSLVEELLNEFINSI